MENENEVVVPETTEEVLDLDTNTGEETVEEIKARLAKAEELANNYKIRAEKAEKKSKEQPRVETKSTSKQELSTSDIYALMTSKVNEEDISEVSDYARMKGISISEALKSPIVRTILKDKEEERNVANATNTSSSKRASSKVSDDVLITKASKGELPEGDDEIVRLIKARKGITK